MAFGGFWGGVPLNFGLCTASYPFWRVPSALPGACLLAKTPITIYLPPLPPYLPSLSPDILSTSPSKQPPPSTDRKCSLRSYRVLCHVRDFELLSVVAGWGFGFGFDSVLEIMCLSETHGTLFCVSKFLVLMWLR